MNFCPNCGEQRVDNSKFCVHCGHELPDYKLTDKPLQETFVEQEDKTRNNVKKNKIVKILLGIGLVAIILLSFLWFRDNPHHSQVKGISDEVYNQLVEQYFYYQGMMDADDIGDFLKKMEKTDQYKAAEKNLEKEAYEYSSVPMQLFPNTLIIDYMSDEDRFSKKEIEYIEKVMDMNFAFATYNSDEFYELAREFKDEMKIKDKYNPFE